MLISTYHGRIADKYGSSKRSLWRKMLFKYWAAHFWHCIRRCAFSVTPEMLIASRALLAVGAAAIMPATMVIVRKVFADPAERSLAIGIWSAVASGAQLWGQSWGIIA